VPSAEKEVRRTEIRNVPCTIERTTPKAKALLGNDAIYNSLRHDSMNLS
jgi:hypothetical protein